MKWRLVLDLPAQFGSILPPAVSRALIAAVFVAAAACLHAALGALAGPGIPPLVTVLPAIVIATLLGGLLAGTVALLGCQLMVWYQIIPLPERFLTNGRPEIESFTVTTFIDLFIILIAASFRKATMKMIDYERERSEALLLMMREMDHRTKNNFQIACSVLRLQAARAGDPAVANALNQAANRILSIAASHDNLSVSSTDFQAISVNLYLTDLCSRIISAVDEDIVFKHDLEDCELDRDKALSLGLIINELVTNSVKHAFAGGGGQLDLNGRITADGYRIMLGDSGPGIEEGGESPGLGQRLIEMLGKKADISIERVAQHGRPGTVYRLLVRSGSARSRPAATPGRSPDQKLILSPASEQ